MAKSVIVALDFETANNARDSACQLAVVRIEGWKVVSEMQWLIRPPSSEFLHTRIHGIEWDHVADKPDFGSLWKDISKFFSGAHYLAAHNAPFDKGVMDACCSRFRVSRPSQQYIDTVHVARKAFQIFPTKLDMVCDKLNIPLNHHEALSDAKACAQILIKANQAGWKI